MNIHDTEAIILATTDHGESDRLITVLTRTSGKLKGIAKGARRSQKRFVHSFEPLSLVALRYRESRSSSLVWMEACKLLNPH
jgi:DNA repair protein RecO (recombination protein O)